MSARFLRSIRHLRTHRVLRGTQEDFAEDPKKIRPLRPELVLRDVPGKSVQRRRHAQRWRWGRRRWRHLRRPLLQTPRREVLRVASTPRRLRLLPASVLALRLRAHLLPVSQTGMRLEPATADPTRALPRHPASVALALAIKNAMTSTTEPQPGWTTSREREHGRERVAERVDHSWRARRSPGHHAARRWTTSREQTRVNSRER
jgi:hypothetical protein